MTPVTQMPRGPALLVVLSSVGPERRCSDVFVFRVSPGPNAKRGSPAPDYFRIESVLIVPIRHMSSPLVGNTAYMSIVLLLVSFA